MLFFFLYCLFSSLVALSNVNDNLTIFLCSSYWWFDLAFHFIVFLISYHMRLEMQVETCGDWFWLVKFDLWNKACYVSHKSSQHLHGILFRLVMFYSSVYGMLPPVNAFIFFFIFSFLLVSVQDIVNVLHLSCYIFLDRQNIIFFKNCRTSI